MKRMLSFLKKKVVLPVRIFSYYTHTKHLVRFLSKTKNSEKIWQVDYEDLRKSTEQIVQELCAFIGVDFEESMLEQYFWQEP